MKSSFYPNNNLRLFRIISFQFQNTPVGPSWARDAGEMNLKQLPWFNLLYPVSHFCAEVKTARFKFQGLASFRPDFNGSGDFLSCQSLEIDVFGREMDGYLNKGPNGQYFDVLAWVIGVDSGSFPDLTLVTTGIYL